MKRIIVCIIFILIFLGCTDMASKKVLYGTWTNENFDIKTDEYDSKVLILSAPTEEMKKDKENNWAGSYKQAYFIKEKVVESKIVTGKWKYNSAFDKEKKGFINSFELKSDDESLLPKTYIFYFNGTYLICTDMSKSPPVTEHFFPSKVNFNF